MANHQSNLALSVEPPSSQIPRFQESLTAQWIWYLLIRVLGFLGVVAALIFLAFMIVRLVPGDPARNLVGISATQQQVDTVREQLGLNQPLLAQAGDYLSSLVAGDLGTSFTTSQPVIEMLAQRLPVTATLAALGLVVVLIIGFPLGIAMGMAEQGGRARRRSGGFTVTSSLVGAAPEYIIGTILVLIFGLQLRWLPVQGGGSWEGMVMPALSIGLAAAAVMARIVRNETRSVLSQEYMAAARAKRVRTSRLVLRHLLPNVVTSTLTLGGLLLVALLGGTVIVENVFNVPGLGTEIVRAILASDYTVIQAIILTLGILAGLINLSVDIVLGILDPRVLQAGVA